MSEQSIFRSRVIIFSLFGIFVYNAAVFNMVCTCTPLVCGEMRRGEMWKHVGKGAHITPRRSFGYRRRRAHFVARNGLV